MCRCSARSESREFGAATEHLQHACLGRRDVPLGEGVQRGATELTGEGPERLTERLVLRRMRAGTRVAGIEYQNFRLLPHVEATSAYKTGRTLPRAESRYQWPHHKQSKSYTEAVAPATAAASPPPNKRRPERST